MIGAWIGRWRRHWRALGRSERGTAAVEFALILPAMLILYIGVAEASALITVDRKVQTVAGAVGDLVARSDGVITTSQLNDYFQAASGIMAVGYTGKLRQVVSSIAVSSSGKSTVQWSRGYNGGKAHTAGETLSLPSQITNIAKGRTVIFSESALSYTPMVNVVLQSDVPLYRSNYFMPRFGEGIAIK